MKLVVITPDWHSKLGGGINTYTVGFVETLRNKADIDIKIGYRDGTEDNNYKLPKGILKSIIGTNKLLKKIRPEIVQVHNDWQLLLGSAIYKSRNKNVILTYVPLTEPKDLNSFKKRLYRRLQSWVYKWSIKRCDYVIIGCHMFWNKFATHYNLKIDNKKAVYISMAITPKDVISKDIDVFRTQFNINKDTIVFLIQAFTAAERKAKGAMLAMKALKKLKKKNPNILLLLTRAGDYSNRLQDFAKEQDMGENVILTGDLDNAIAPLEMCDIFLWPWLGESGFGLALLEAMLAGKPIVATSITGNLPPLINGENALVVEASESAVYDGILRLLDDKKLAEKLGGNACKTAYENYTWDRVGDKFIELYKIEKNMK